MKAEVLKFFIYKNMYSKESISEDLRENQTVKHIITQSKCQTIISR